MNKFYHYFYTLGQTPGNPHEGFHAELFPTLRNSITTMINIAAALFVLFVTFVDVFNIITCHLFIK